MILELEHDQTGSLDYLGQMWTWVSAQAGVTATMTGPWINVMELHAGKRLDLYAGEKLELKAGKKLELRNG